MSKVVKGESIQVKGSTYVLVDIDKDKDEKKESVPKDGLIPVTNVSKHKGIRLFYADQMVDPNGFPVVGLDKSRSFAIAGEVMAALANKTQRKKSGKKGKSGRYLTKPPPIGSKVFGNENVPKIAVHLNPMKNYMYCQFLPSAVYASSTTLNQVTTYSWTLGQLDNITSLASLYDEYCVRRIEIWFIPGLTENSSSGQYPCQLYTAYDIDGSTITLLSDIRQYDTLVESSATVGQYCSFTPSVAVATYGGAFTKYSFEQNQWLDVANTDITLYGFCSVLDTSTQASQFQFSVDVRMWVEFRGVR